MTAVTLAASEPVSAYETLFIERLASQVERAPKPLMALDCRCGNGFTTRALFSSLPPGSRVVAIGEDRAELDVFHRTLEPALRPAIFVRKESALRLPFDEGVFDLAWASLATGRLPDDPRPLFRQLVRALRPPGQLLIATPLRETVVELRSAVTARLGQDDAKVRAMVQEDTPLWSGKEWQDAFR